MAVAPVTVRVILVCTNQQFQVKVRPWLARIAKPGQGIVWRPSKSIKQIGISKERRRGGLPFEHLVLRGNAAHPPKGRKLKPGSKGKQYRYRITLKFPDPRGSLRRVVIDPDMVVET